MKLLARIVQHAESRPDGPAVLGLDATGNGESTILSYGALLNAARHLADRLHLHFEAGAYVGLAMGNSAEWIVADLALMLGGLVEVPVPMAFSAEQAAHLLQHCAIVLTDRLGSAQLAAWRAHSDQPFPVEIAFDLDEYDGLPPKPLPMPRAAEADGICKVIHTSGTTSRPKGVRIRRHGLDALLDALWACADEHDYRRYLSLVPFSLLIEQVTALYMPFASGGAVLLPPASLPPVGSPGVRAGDRLELIEHARPTALTLTPAMVEAIAEKGREVATAPVTDTVRSAVVHHVFDQDRAPFLAAGGAPLDPAVLYKLADWGIPVYQGYGLSENSSVATWNRRGANRIGTVGQPLPHVEVKLSADGELCLRSTSLFAGYSGADPSSCSLDDDGWLHTGDLAAIDEDNYVSIIGRRKTLIITSNGRNISPEWLESRYRSISDVAEVVVFGDGHQFLSGIFLCQEGSDPHLTGRAIRAFAETHLSEIERVTDPILVPDSPEVRKHLFTVTGRPRRDAVEEFIRTLNQQEIPMLNVAPHTKRSGGIVAANEPIEITSVGRDVLLDLLARHGYLVLRGFDTDIDAFSRLVRQTSGRISLDPARRFNGDTAQKVDAGTGPVGLHCENGNSPFWPELCWFYCQREPVLGSQTTVCDGYLVYDELSPEARAAFVGQDIVYSRRVPETLWKTYALHALADQEDGPKQLDQVTVEHLQELMATGEGSVTLNEDNSIHYRFRTSAIRQSAISGEARQAFANSIFGPSYNYETPVITFADGTPIPADLLAEVDAVCDRHTHEVGWHTGDVVLIDNTRVMHGRRCIADAGRIIYNALSYRA